MRWRISRWQDESEY